MKDNKPFDLDAIDALWYGVFDKCYWQDINYANKDLFQVISERTRNIRKKYNVDTEVGAKLLSDYLTRKMEEKRLSSLHIGVEFHLWAFDEKGQVIPATEIQLYPFTK